MLASEVGLGERRVKLILIKVEQHSAEGSISAELYRVTPA